MPYKEHFIEKKYFTINELAKELRVPTSTIRWYEYNCPFLNPRKDGEKNRKYSRKDVKKIQEFVFLKKQGITIDNIRKHWPQRRRLLQVIMPDAEILRDEYKDT